MDPEGGREGLNKRQINENEVLNLAYSHPDLLTGVNPATGQPQLYGSVGVDINCAVIGYTATAPLIPWPPQPPGLPVPAQVTGEPPQALPCPCGRTGGAAPQSPRGPAIAGPRAWIASPRQWHQALVLPVCTYRALTITALVPLSPGSWATG